MATASTGRLCCRGMPPQRSCSHWRIRGMRLLPPTGSRAVIWFGARPSRRAPANTTSNRSSSWASKPRSTNKAFRRLRLSRRGWGGRPAGLQNTRASSALLSWHLSDSAASSRAPSRGAPGQRWAAIQRSISRPPRATPALPITRAQRRAWRLELRSRPAKRSSWAMGAGRPSPPSRATRDRSMVPPPRSTTSTVLPAGNPAPMAAAVGSSTRASSGTSSSRHTSCSHWR